jgi:transcriptional regulator with XRE-family HTH domain
MVAYYEIQTSHPPTHLLAHLAQALGVTADQLLGIQKVKEVKQKDSRLWQRFAQVEKLPPAKRKKIVDILDAFLGKS